MPRKLTQNNGFTLIEVLVAMTILAIGLLAVAGMQITAMRTNSSAQTLTANVAIASGVLDEIYTWPATTSMVDGTYAWDFDPDTDGNQTTTVEGGGTYSAQYTVDANYDAGSGSIDKITRIEVNVDQTNGNQRRITLVGFKRSI